MCDFEERIHTVQVNLPQLEKVRHVGMKGRKLNGSFARSKRKNAFVVFEQLTPSVLDSLLADNFSGGFAAVFWLRDL